MEVDFQAGECFDPAAYIQVDESTGTLPNLVLHGAAAALLRQAGLADAATQVIIWW
jgi:hypothetical protein